MKPIFTALLTKNATPGGEGSIALPTAFVTGIVAGRAANFFS
jgi:hypothetical protein